MTTIRGMQPVQFSSSRNAEFLNRQGAAMRLQSELRHLGLNPGQIYAGRSLPYIQVSVPTPELMGAYEQFLSRVPGITNKGLETFDYVSTAGYGSPEVKVEVRLVDDRERQVL